MKEIIYNPYRVIGILSGSSAREFQKQKNNINAYSKANKEITSEYDFNFLPTITRKESTINQAFSRLEHNNDKVYYSLFWFVNANTFDNTALEYLKQGNTDKAIEIWKKVTNNKSVSKNNFSSFNNLSSIYLFNNTSIALAIQLKIKLILSDYFTDFVHIVADETLSVEPQKEMERFIDGIVAIQQNTLSMSELQELFEMCDEKARQYLNKKLTQTPIQNIEREIEQAKSQRKEDKARAYNIGIALYAGIKQDLENLKLLLSSDDLKYKMLADGIAKEMKYCSVDYFNYHQDNETESDYLEEAMRLVKMAKSIAISSFVKEEIDDAIESLEDMKDSEINQAIVILSSIKNKYENTLKETIAEIVKIEADGKVIDWIFINKEIKNILNWKKVIEVIQQTIPTEDINVIQNTKNKNKLQEYKELVNFIIDKIDNSDCYNEELLYLKFWYAPAQDLGMVGLAPELVKPLQDFKNKITFSSQVSSGFSTIIITIIMLIVRLFLGFLGIALAGYIMHLLS